MATGHDEPGSPGKLTPVSDGPESQSRRRLLTGGLAAGTAIATGALPWKARAAGTVLLQSRCIDETGYVQPTPAELQQVRGMESIYHNNGIQTRQVKEDGTVENVRLG